MLQALKCNTDYTTLYLFTYLNLIKSNKGKSICSSAPGRKSAYSKASSSDTDWKYSVKEEVKETNLKKLKQQYNMPRRVIPPPVPKLVQPPP